MQSPLAEVDLRDISWKAKACKACEASTSRDSVTSNTTLALKLSHYLLRWYYLPDLTFQLYCPGVIALAVLKQNRSSRHHSTAPLSQVPSARFSVSAMSG